MIPFSVVDQATSTYLSDLSVCYIRSAWVIHEIMQSLDIKVYLVETSICEGFDRLELFKVFRLRFHHCFCATCIQIHLQVKNIRKFIKNLPSDGRPLTFSVAHTLRTTSTQSVYVFQRMKVCP